MSLKQGYKAFTPLLKSEMTHQHSKRHNTHIPTRSCSGLVYVKLYINLR